MLYLFPLAYTRLKSPPSWKHFSQETGLVFLFSRDLEDLVYLFENAEGIEKALINSTGKLKACLVSSFSLLLQHEDFEEGLFTHLHPAYASFIVKKTRESGNSEINSLLQ